MNCNQAGIDLIKSFEGFRSESYQDQGGIWTIGYGHTKDVFSGMTCTQDEALLWLHEDLQGAESIVSKHICVPLNGNQFSALVSFAYNIGGGNFVGSTALALLNRGGYDQIPEQLSRWNRVAGTPNAGLARRRAAEADLWNAPDDNSASA